MLVVFAQNMLFLNKNTNTKTFFYAVLTTMGLLRRSPASSLLWPTFLFLLSCSHKTHI